MIAFKIPDMNDTRGTHAVTAAVRSRDRAAVVHIDLPTRIVEIGPVRASARQLGDAIRQAGHSPQAE
jgi:copper chaperone